jgi:Zn-dependent protease with chaperone function
MRLDGANRSFLACICIALLLSAYVLWGAIGGVLVPLVRARAAHDGIAGMLGDGAALPTLSLFALPVAIGLVLAGRLLVLQSLASHRLARRVRRLARPLPSGLRSAATQARLGGRVVLVEAPQSFSFVFGALTPRVVVSRRLLESVSARELLAVLAHERYHVRNLDPLKLLLMRSLSAALFCLPAFEALRLNYLAERELAADRHAVVVCGRRPLVGALLKVVRGPDWSELDLVATIGGPELLGARVAQLETGVEPRLRPLSLADAASSLLSVAALLAAFLASISSFGGPTAVYRATGTGLATATLLGGLLCAAPLAGVGLLVYLAIARRAGRALEFEDRGRPPQTPGHSGVRDYDQHAN